MALMLATRLCRTPILNKSLAVKPLQVKNVYRTFAEEGRDAVARAARRKQPTLKERLMGPPGDTGLFILPKTVRIKFYQNILFYIYF